MTSVDPVDLLVFGPHPDDIEIGLGGTVAQHVGVGSSRWAVRPDRGRDGQQRHRRGTPARGGGGACVLGAAWRDESATGPTAASGRRSRASRGRVIRRAGRAPSPFRTARSASRITWPPALPDRGGFKSRLRRYEADGEPGAPTGVLLLHQRRGDAVVRRRRLGRLREKRHALACHASQFAPRGTGAVATRLTAATFRQLIESRDAQFGALAGVAFAEGIVVREPIVRTASVAPAKPGRAPMRIGIVCYASVGGSGIVATELGKALAERGHSVHLVRADPPFGSATVRPG